MTLKEFEELIDSIDLDTRDESKYTKEEIYNIGCAFIQMTAAEKRRFGGWDKLVEILKPLDKNGEVMKKGDTLRVWIKGSRYRKEEMIHDERLISGKTIDDITFEEFENQTEAIKQSLYKQQVKTRDTLNSYRRSLRDDARVEYMNDIIKESILNLKELPFIEFNKPTECNGNVEAVMLFSDLHIGLEVNNFFNVYNVEVAKKRVARYVDRTIELCRKNGVRRLNILNLGDLISGNLRTTARIENNQDVIEQVMTASEIMSEALNKLQEAAPEVIYRSCSDNHSRVTPNFKENIEKENYFRLIDFYLEARLKDTNIVFSHDNLDVDLGMFELMNGKRAVFAHGHRENLSTIVQGFMGAIRGYVDYVFVGHFHETKMKSFQGAKVFVNSSICGPDNYAQSKRLYGVAEQTLLIVDGDVESVNHINLDIK